jgi:ribosome-associated protein
MRGFCFRTLFPVPFLATVEQEDDVMQDQEVIKLDQFLKLRGLVQTGGQAKLLIQAGEVRVNGAVETRRGRKLVKGDRISTMGETIQVQ